MAEVPLSSISFEHLGKHVREITEPTGPMRRGWVRIAGRIVGVRHAYDRPQRADKKGKPVGPTPEAFTSLIVETGRDQGGAVHREIYAPSTQKVDLNS